MKQSHHDHQATPRVLSQAEPPRKLQVTKHDQPMVHVQHRLQRATHHKSSEFGAPRPSGLYHQVDSNQTRPTYGTRATSATKGTTHHKSSTEAKSSHHDHQAIPKLLSQVEPPRRQSLQVTKHDQPMVHVQHPLQRAPPITNQVSYQLYSIV